MTRTAREISVYGFYHVVQKGCADQLIFEDDEDRLYLIRLIASKCQKFKVDVLSPAVFQAVDRHTVGACDMTPLDMVVFVADAIEPNRHGDYAHALRKMVGKSSLDELFFSCFAQGLVYVIQSGRYLYPTAITIYNHYAQLR